MLVKPLADSYQCSYRPTYGDLTVIYEKRERKIELRRMHALKENAGDGHSIVCFWAEKRSDDHGTEQTLHECIEA